MARIGLRSGGSGKAAFKLSPGRFYAVRQPDKPGPVDIESWDCGCEENESCEAGVSLAVACCYASVTFDFLGEVFHEVPSFAHLASYLAGCFRFFHGGMAGAIAFGKSVAKPIRIECAACHHVTGLPASGRAGIPHRSWVIIELPRRKTEIGEISKCIDRCGKLRRYAAVRLAYSRALSLPFAL